jgi:hypothetical protein
VWAPCQQRRVERRDGDPAGNDLRAGLGRDREPDGLGVGQGRLDEEGAAVDEAGQRVAEAERRDVVKRDDVDRVELGVRRMGASATVR